MHLSRKIWIRGGIVAGVVLILFAGVLAATGGLDLQVLSEAPKSLKYRLEYWTGTWQVIEQHPWLGVGPGNFRSHYLRFKLPESSEEIADPHQMALDVWVHGGIVSLVGLGVLLALTVKALRQHRSSSPEAEHLTARFSGAPWAWGGIGSFLLVALAQFLSGEPWDARVALCGLTLSVLLPFGLWAFAAGFSSPFVLGLGALALGVHLQGAGGIAMPAVAQFFFLLPALAIDVVNPPTSDASVQHKLYRSTNAMAVLFVALVMCLVTAFVPTWQSRSLVALGDAVLYAGQSPRAAEAYYRRAAEADDWNPSAFERLAQLSYSLWSAGRDEAFPQAVENMHEAIARDPFNHNGYQRLGLWYLERYRRTGDLGDAIAAADMLQQAAERYPASAELQLQWAQSSQAAGRREQALRAAIRARELDEINRRYSHADKYLTEEELAQIEALLSGH